MLDKFDGSNVNGGYNRLESTPKVAQLYAFVAAAALAALAACSDDNGVGGPADAGSDNNYTAEVIGSWIPCDFNKVDDGVLSEFCEGGSGEDLRPNDEVEPAEEFVLEERGGLSDPTSGIIVDLSGMKEPTLPNSTE